MLADPGEKVQRHDVGDRRGCQADERRSRRSEHQQQDDEDECDGRHGDERQRALDLVELRRPCEQHAAAKTWRVERACVTLRRGELAVLVDAVAVVEVADGRRAVGRDERRGKRDRRPRMAAVDRERDLGRPAKLAVSQTAVGVLDDDDPRDECRAERLRLPLLCGDGARAGRDEAREAGVALLGDAGQRVDAEEHRDEPCRNEQEAQPHRQPGDGTGDCRRRGHARRDTHGVRPRSGPDGRDPPRRMRGGSIAAVTSGRCQCPSPATGASPTARGSSSWHRTAPITRSREPGWRARRFPTIGGRDHGSARVTR